MLINKKKTVQVNAKTLQLHIKVCDSFGGVIIDEEGETLVDKDDGYVPDFMPCYSDGSSHFGDYLILDIDLDSGMITNWKKPTPEQIERFMGDGTE